MQSIAIIPSVLHLAINQKTSITRILFLGRRRPYSPAISTRIEHNRQTVTALQSIPTPPPPPPCGLDWAGLNCFGKYVYLLVSCTAPHPHRYMYCVRGQLHSSLLRPEQGG